MNQPERLFGWSDMFVHPDADPRTDGGYVGERETLVGFLRDQRLTLQMKCSGLDAEQLARRSVEPSETWQAEIAFAERFVDETTDLGMIGKAGDRCARSSST